MASVAVSVDLSFFKYDNKLPRDMKGIIIHGAGPRSRHTPVRDSTFGLSNFDIKIHSSTIAVTSLFENNPTHYDNTYNKFFKTNILIQIEFYYLFHASSIVQLTP